MEERYMPTECKFTVTQYFDTKLYALHTKLVSSSFDQVNFVIALGNNVDYVKQIAKYVDKSACLKQYVFLAKEHYKNVIPFFIKDKGSVRCYHDGTPILSYEYDIWCPKYYNGDKSFYFKHNDAKSRFDYLVRRGDLIEAVKENEKWHLPKNINEILFMPPKYKTDVIPLSELLK